MGDNFVQETGAFLTAAKASFSELDDSWKEMKTKVCFYETLEGDRTIQLKYVRKYFVSFLQYEKSVGAFGEDPKTITSDDFFGIFNTFLISFAVST